MIRRKKEKKIILLNNNREVVDSFDEAITLAKSQGYEEVVFTISSNESKGHVGITFERPKQRSFLIKKKKVVKGRNEV